jgi:hypothetical protein
MQRSIVRATAACMTPRTACAPTRNISPPPPALPLPPLQPAPCPLGCKLTLTACTCILCLRPTESRPPPKLTPTPMPIPVVSPPCMRSLRTRATHSTSAPHRRGQCTTTMLSIVPATHSPMANASLCRTSGASLVATPSPILFGNRCNRALESHSPCAPATLQGGRKGRAGTTTHDVSIKCDQQRNLLHIQHAVAAVVSALMAVSGNLLWMR